MRAKGRDEITGNIHGASVEMAEPEIEKWLDLLTKKEETGC